jgi:hypothetical protein
MVVIVFSVAFKKQDNRIKVIIMRQMKKLILVGLLALLVATPVSAEWLFGAKTGSMVIDSAGVSDATNSGIMVGYQIGAVVADLALEAEITKTTGEGQFSGSGVSLNTQALYLAFRTAGPFYLKAKAGYVNEDVRGVPGKGKESGAAYGIGLGFGIGIAQLELELTSMNKDIAYVSLGVQF